MRSIKQKEDNCVLKKLQSTFENGKQIFEQQVWLWLGLRRKVISVLWLEGAANLERYFDEDLKKVILSADRGVGTQSVYLFQQDCAGFLNRIVWIS